jgi:hypothetical protein
MRVAARLVQPYIRPMNSEARRAMLRGAWLTVTILLGG